MYELKKIMARKQLFNLNNEDNETYYWLLKGLASVMSLKLYKAMGWLALKIWN